VTERDVTRQAPAVEITSKQRDKMDEKMINKTAIVWGWDYQRGCYVGESNSVIMFRIYRRSTLYVAFVGCNVEPILKGANLDIAKKGCLQYIANFISGMSRHFE